MKSQKNNLEPEKDQTYDSVMLWSEVILKAAHWFQFNSVDPAIHQKSDDIQVALNLLLNELVEVKKGYATMFGEMQAKLEAANVQEKILRVEISDVRKMLDSSLQLVQLKENKIEQMRKQE